MNLISGDEALKQLFISTSNYSSTIDNYNLENEFPSANQFYDGLTLPFEIAIGIAAILFLIIFIIFIIQIPAKIKDNQFTTRTLILLGYYPIVGLAALISISLPKAIILCDTICHLAFTFCAYQFFCLCIDYANGESNFIKLAGDQRLFCLRVPPCCCMVCIKPTIITKTKFSILRIMCLQMPIIQGGILLVFNLLFNESPELYTSGLYCLGPFLGISIITGVWSLQMTARMISSLFHEHRILPKYFAMQLVLVICKLQPFIAQGILMAVELDFNYPITNRVFGNTIVQIVILVETLFLSLWAQRLYKPITSISEN